MSKNILKFSSPIFVGLKENDQIWILSFQMSVCPFQQKKAVRKNYVLKLIDHLCTDHMCTETNRSFLRNSTAPVYHFVLL